MSTTQGSHSGTEFENEVGGNEDARQCHWLIDIKKER